MEPTDVTVEILGEIRDELKKTRADLSARIDQTNARLDQTRSELSARIDQTREELGRHIVESEIRTATAITELAGAFAEVKEILVDRLDLRDRVTRCEQEIDQIKRRLGST